MLKNNSYESLHDEDYQLDGGSPNISVLYITNKKHNIKIFTTSHSNCLHFKDRIILFSNYMILETLLRSKKIYYDIIFSHELSGCVLKLVLFGNTRYILHIDSKKIRDLIIKRITL